MDPRRWSEIEDVLSAAIDADAGARPDLLAERCAGRPDLRAEVESLLAAHEMANRFLEPAPEPPIDADPATSGIGAFVDAYRLVALIGHGGMGDVHLAERDDGTFAHRVAVKIGRTTLGTHAARRFQSEQQILAALHHPHIVALFDGGTLADGRPYIVMELVEGAPITRYCREAALDLNRRLRLFRLVCSAVQHAHRHAVVHRDIKPANILVTADGVPKVLDFGIAKLLDSPSASASPTLTGPWSGPLTPNYASPEQLRGLSVTTASDIYALGVLLYELAAGVRPYETEGKPLDEVMEIVLRGDPPRPSAAAASGGGVPVADAHRLRGDLDAVIAKAMSKDPVRRYASAEELAEDVGRFLDRRPVVAREPSFGYAAWSLARRHRAGVAAAALAMAGIFAALGVALWQRQVAERERARAERNFADTRRIANALIFKIHDAIGWLPGSTPARKTIADEAARYLARLEADAGHDPTLDFELAVAYARLGEVLGLPSKPNLGDRAGALRQFQRAKALLGPLAAPDHASDAILIALIETDNAMSTVLINLGQPSAEEARSARRESVATAERLLRRAPASERYRSLVGSAVFQLAVGEQGRAALPHWERAREVYESLLSEKPDDPGRMRNVALVCKYVGTVHDNEGDLDAADREYRRALDLDERRLSLQPDARQVKFDVANDLANLSEMASRRADHRSAATMLERCLRMRQELVDADPDDVLARRGLGSAHMRLARQYRHLRHFAGARIHYTRAAAVLEASLAGPDDVHTRLQLGVARYGFGLLARDEGKQAEACGQFRSASNDFEAVRARTALTPAALNTIAEFAQDFEACEHHPAR
jgi:non-specific serine/threonine protein kinase/serine/threonine-protein kinase